MGLGTTPQRITEQEIRETPGRALVLDDTDTGHLTKGSVTPSILNNEHWKAVNTAPITITNFAHGQDTQHLYILGDGFTTVQNNAKIVTKSGSDTLLAAGVMYQFVCMFGASPTQLIWYQL